MLHATATRYPLPATCYRYRYLRFHRAATRYCYRYSRWRRVATRYCYTLLALAPLPATTRVPTPRHYPLLCANAAPLHATATCAPTPHRYMLHVTDIRAPTPHTCTLLTFAPRGVAAITASHHSLLAHASPTCAISLTACLLLVACHNLRHVACCLTAALLAACCLLLVACCLLLVAMCAASLAAYRYTRRFAHCLSLVATSTALLTAYRYMHCSAYYHYLHGAPHCLLLIATRTAALLPPICTRVIAAALPTDCFHRVPAIINHAKACRYVSRHFPCLADR
ncbi:hypothetical protein GGX14DRAFT_553591 [Mycena pura]|uniref:Uncharacterized protein n=1 Tax=Mycena pura TaxID=153505 RepID=A0AAD7E664_9AGAR|nr:hypothetical protein GGX14DRAFT_553591 [Mycena pura]